MGRRGGIGLTSRGPEREQDSFKGALTRVPVRVSTRVPFRVPRSVPLGEPFVIRYMAKHGSRYCLSMLSSMTAEPGHLRMHLPRKVRLPPPALDYADADGGKYGLLHMLIISDDKKIIDVRDDHCSPTMRLRTYPASEHGMAHAHHC